MSRHHSAMQISPTRRVRITIESCIVIANLSLSLRVCVCVEVFESECEFMLIEKATAYMGTEVAFKSMSTEVIATSMDTGMAAVNMVAELTATNMDTGVAAKGKDTEALTRLLCRVGRTGRQVSTRVHRCTAMWC